MSERELVSRLHEILRDGFVAGGVSNERIAEAEDALSVSFPRSYRLFLQHFGAGGVAGFEVSGLIPSAPDPNEPPMWSDVEERTKELRRVSGEHLPPTLIPVSDDGGDYTFFLDTARESDEGEVPVVVFGPGRDGEEVAKSFVDFLDRGARGESLL